MPHARILELEQLLATANESLAKLTAAVTDLTRQLTDAETRNKKLKRSARNGESALQEQLTAARNRRS